MILFYAAGASSLAPHVLLREAAIEFSIEKVDLHTKRWSGGDFNQISPKSYVPALQTEDGTIFTECGVILQYIADLTPAASLIPVCGTIERYHALEWLNFIATEIHKNFITPERHGSVAANFLAKTAAGQDATRRLVSPRLAYVDRMLEGRPYLSGDVFSAPDAYLFAMLTWAGRLDLSLAPWHNLQGFFDRVVARPAVRKTLDVEGPPHSLRPEVLTANNSK
jgi:glutathione S-transferase